MAGKSLDSARPIDRAESRPPVWLPLAVAAAALALYVLTLAPGLLWGGGDFATFQLAAYEGSNNTQQGVFAHPLWVVLAHPFTAIPLRDAAWRANFATAVFAALALLLVFLSAWRLTRSTAVALLASGALLVSHTFWTYAVMPKVYSLNALLVTACCYLLIRWRENPRNGLLYPAALLYGLSFLNHLVMVTVAAGFAAFVVGVLWPRWREAATRRAALLAVACFGAGLLPYLVLVFRGGAEGTTGGTAFAFLAGTLYVLRHPPALFTALFWGVALGTYQFPLTSIVGLVGLGALWRGDRPAAMLVGLAILGTLAFLIAAADPAAGGPYVWNLHYYLQAYVVFPLAIAAGFRRLWLSLGEPRTLHRLTVAGATLVFPCLLYAVAPLLARGFVRNVPDFRPLAGRDNLTYVLSPWKQNETGARELGETILNALPTGSVLFADYSLWAIVHYLQVVEHARPDVTPIMLPGSGEQLPLILAHRDSPNLFLADIYRYYDVEQIQAYFAIVPSGPVYKLVPR
jgi:hypothetical protein